MGILSLMSLTKRLLDAGICNMKLVFNSEVGHSGGILNRIKNCLRF